MAAKTRKPKCPLVDCNVEFEGILRASDTARLIQELLKYLLYHRHQIHMPFDQVKLETKKAQEVSDNMRHCQYTPHCLSCLSEVIYNTGTTE